MTVTVTVTVTVMQTTKKFGTKTPKCNSDSHEYEFFVAKQKDFAADGMKDTRGIQTWFELVTLTKKK